MDIVDVWPLTVVRTRYGGVYEGGVFAAFHLSPDELPDGWDGDDTSCFEWWLSPTVPVGVGGSASAAASDLLDRLTEGL